MWLNQHIIESCEVEEIVRTFKICIIENVSTLHEYTCILECCDCLKVTTDCGDFCE